ncbi:hypothetical protein EMIHUDRAFT_355055 [Emiliania huxleyi CCMP1516]|uniref:Cation efflux protein cytoplasmic domain-containing protein n=2 Tax=Emiliania huxleyi TaxID=2903 RepID=A0A0D3JAB4_EMIH1|nr:hypothetical protein EMIHUDRAFT_355055 [Emiliania huxleyi CCMP1516]EOD20449.1 hypothetical protein EMIHUDRAFT_355055 [Emiliania huxleyi CCMP1516]|eukprot:XP_005772878.1 hypothetical protein EMIHUDRAFT_355055 [Emiliania huxleyi CCMP1516]
MLAPLACLLGQACAVLLLFLLGLSGPGAAPLCSSLALGLGAAECAASHPELLARLWPRPASQRALPFGAAKLPALVRFGAAVVVLGAALLITTDLLLSHDHGHSHGGDPRHSAAGRPAAGPSATVVWVAAAAAACGSTPRAVLEARGVWAAAWAAGEGLPVLFLLLAVSRAAGDTAASLSLLGVAAARAVPLLAADGRRLMLGSAGGDGEAKYAALLQRAASLPDVTAVYDAAFWPLDEEGAEVGVIRCTLAPGRDAAAAAEEVRAVFAAGAGASLRHLTVHVDEG